MEEKAAKGVISGIGAILAHLHGSFTPLIYVLIAFMIFDYVTGMISAVRHKKVSSKDAFWGAVKKFCYFFLVAVAFLFDYALVETTKTMGLDFEWTIFGILSVCYLLSTEAISVLENLAEIGIEVPFLTKALNFYREKISRKGEEKNE